MTICSGCELACDSLLRLCVCLQGISFASPIVIRAFAYSVDVTGIVWLFGHAIRPKGLLATPGSRNYFPLWVESVIISNVIF